MSVLAELIQKVETFNPGDLVAGVEIVESFTALIENPEEAGENADMLRTLSQEFSGIVQQSPDGDEEVIKSGILKGLKKLSAASMQPGETAPSMESDEDEEEVEDLDVLNSFIVEARDHLENIEDKILSLEKSLAPDTVNEIFRSMHTIKGVSSFLGLRRIKTLSHHMESVLDDIRMGTVQVSPELVDTLLEGVDILARLVADLAQKSEEKVAGGSVRVREMNLDTEGTIAKLAASAGQKKAEPSMEEELFTPEMVEKFVAESLDLLDAAEKALLDLEGSSNQMPLIDEAFRSVHTIKGNSGFFWYGYIEKLCMDVESILDIMRKDPQAVRNTVISSLLSAVDEIRSGLQRIQAGELKPGEYSVDDHGIYHDERIESGEAKPLGELLVEMGVVTREAVEEALDKQGMRLGELLVREGATDAQSIEAALKQQGRPIEAAAETASAYAFKRKDIRVDTARLDQLFDLMGELITAEAMVLHNPDIAALDLPDFQKSSAYLSKITREMQEITMAIRMIPLDGLFNKMRRLVRDLSRKFDKNVNFHISGEDTEMDRNVMEEISDPLVHIIRNAIDHGIEPAEKRRKAKKPEAGNIYLDAKYEGNEIWISIQDDGGGLNKERILEKSRERGIVDPTAQPADQEIYQLIFEPGFSTAQQVSEISGRGVGMDVVKRNLEKLRGKIDIRSDAGMGTEFILRIPLTLAIIDGIIARVGSMLYAIPINDVTSFQKVDSSQITETDDKRSVFRLRDDLIPIIKLTDFFAIPDGGRSVEDGTVVVSQSGRRSVALLADEIVGYRQIVVKALPEYMGSMRAISGCSIMGDGEVSLILDIGAIINEELD
jgi:two-component system, chemotaxis family, sensor kinase CheA